MFVSSIGQLGPCDGNMAGFKRLHSPQRIGDLSAKYTQSAASDPESCLVSRSLPNFTRRFRSHRGPARCYLTGNASQGRDATLTLAGNSRCNAMQVSVAKGFPTLTYPLGHSTRDEHRWLQSTAMAWFCESSMTAHSWYSGRSNVAFLVAREHLGGERVNVECRGQSRD
jgi:hypothetical protein